MTTRYEAAKFYVEELGLSVIPIRKGEKRPAIDWKRFQKEKPSQSHLVDWFHQGDHQIGVVCGAVSGGLTVIDFETSESYEEWARRHPSLKETRTVETGKGVHVYFFLPQCRGNQKLIPSLVETRGEGGQVLAPPSLHPSGRHYKLKGNIRTILRTTWAEVSRGERWGKRESEGIDRERVARTIAGGAEEGNRNDSIFTAAVVLRDSGKSQQATLKILLESNEHNTPPLPANEIARTVESAFSRKGKTISAEPRELDTILEQIADLRESRNEHWTRGDEPPNLYDHLKEVFRHSGHLDSAEIEEALVEVERKPAPLAEKCRAELRKIWTAARKFAQAGGVFVVRPDRPSTWPYDVKDGRLVYLTERVFFDTVTVQQMPVADFHAKITCQITNEDKTRTFVVKGRAKRGGPFEFEMDAEEFGNDRKLKAVIDAASGAKDPVRAGMGKHLTPALQLLAGEEMTQFKRYRRTGWVDGCFLIPGREPDGVLVELPHKPPFSISKDADLSHGLSALEALLESMTPERASVATALIFQAPLSKLARWENERYAIFISGRTGSLKTSFAQVLMCIYGKRFVDDEMLVKWGEGATANAMMSMATAAHDMPFLIDNFKPSTGGGARAFIGLIHNILEGGEKDRLNRSSKLRETKPIFCWPICTGEDVPDSDPASLARILVVPFLWQRGEDNDELTKAQMFAEHLPAVGGTWLDWLETGNGKRIISRLASKFPAYRSDWSKRLRRLRDDSVNTLRVASNLASNQLTWEIMCEHPTIGPLACRFKDAHLLGLRDIVALAMSTATAEALEATRYLATLKELIITGQANIIRTDHSANDRTIGYYDAAGIYLLPKIARRAVEQLLSDDLNGISQSALHKQLSGQGLIASHNKGTFLKSKQVGGAVARVLHLRDGTLDESEPAEPEVIPF